LSVLRGTFLSISCSNRVRFPQTSRLLLVDLLALLAGFRDLIHDLHEHDGEFLWFRSARWQEVGTRHGTGKFYARLRRLD